MSQRDYIPELDGLRAFAVGCVLLSHLHIRTSIFPEPRSNIFGFIGVDIFFALSGFLITRILLFNREHGVGLGRFFWSRAARLLPASWIGLAIIAVFWHGSAWSAFFYLYNFDRVVGQHGVAPLNHYWSLCIEEQFYLLWAPAIMLLPRRLSLRLTMLGVLLMPIASILFLEIFPAKHLYWFVSFATIPRGWPLLAGSLVAFYERPLRQHAFALPVAGVSLMVAGIAWTSFPPSLLPIPSEVFSALARQIACVGVLLLVLWPRFCERFTVLRDVSIQWMGKISYGLYIYHLPVYVALGVFQPSVNQDWYALAAIAISFVAATLSYYLVEQPIIAWAKSRPSASALERLLLRRKSASPDSSGCPARTERPQNTSRSASSLK